MTVNLYSVRDIHSGFGQVFTAQNDAVAIREFRLAISRKDNVMFTSCNDFDLMRLGSFDADLGSIEPCAPTIIANGYSIAKEFGDV